MTIALSLYVENVAALLHSLSRGRAFSHNLFLYERARVAHTKHLCKIYTFHCCIAIV